MKQNCLGSVLQIQLIYNFTGAPQFKNSDFYKKRMDNFYVTILGEKPKFKELFSGLKVVCILSHGNATVESGFSST